MEPSVQLNSYVAFNNNKGFCIYSAEDMQIPTGCDPKTLDVATYAGLVKNDVSGGCCNESFLVNVSLNPNNSARYGSCCMARLYSLF